MSQVDRIIGQQVEKAAKHARQYLKRAALESVEYVASGKVLCRDLAEQFGITEEMARLVVQANKLNLLEEIRKV